MVANCPLPLHGIRVLELGHAVMGPSCGLVLADLGAEVIKVEPAPEGDDTRRLAGFGSGFFLFYNRNKKSLALDLKSEPGKELLRKIISFADVMVENFAPGTVERLGFGYPEVARMNPRLIYCALKGFMRGPYERRPALDEVVQMMSGLAYMTGPPGRPLRAGSSIIDILGGTFGVIGILTALHERKKTGQGQLVTASLFESAVFLMGQHMAHALLSGKPVPPMPARVSAWAIYDLFESKEGEMVFVGVTSDMQWKRFCKAFALAGLYGDERLSTNNQRITQRDWLIPELQREFKKRGKKEILNLCTAAEIPFSTIARPEDLFEDVHLNAGGSLVETVLPSGIKAKMPRIPVRMGSYDFGLRHNPPEVGEGSYELLKSIGISDEEIGRLKKTGVLAFSQEFCPPKGA